MTAEIDRVRIHTAPEVLQEIDAAIEETILLYSTKPERDMSARIEFLEHEWDIERYLETNASTLALTGVVLGVAVNKKWLWLSGGVLAFLFQHSVQGWCPPVSVLRRMGIRTKGEIDREKYALKALRGDFDAVHAQNDPLNRAHESLLASVI